MRSRSSCPALSTSLVSARAVFYLAHFRKRAIGFTATPANLLSVPVYAVACVATCTVGYITDRYGNRGYWTMCVLLLWSCILLLMYMRVSQGLLERWPGWLHHPHRVAQRDALIHRRLPRRVRHLPEHPEHHRMGVEQRRGLLQALRLPRDGHLLRQYQRRRLLQRRAYFLPISLILPRARHSRLVPP